MSNKKYFDRTFISNSQFFTESTTITKIEKNYTNTVTEKMLASSIKVSKGFDAFKQPSVYWGYR